MIDPNIDAVARSLNDADQPHASFRALDAALKASVGHILFTILISHHEIKQSERIYTNMPVDYPVGGTKPIKDTGWTRLLLDEGQPYIGRTKEDIAWAFYDHALIHSLGCESVLNMPVRWRGRTIGTINLLDRANAYDETQIPIVRALAQMALPAMLSIA